MSSGFPCANSLRPKMPRGHAYHDGRRLLWLSGGLYLARPASSCLLFVCRAEVLSVLHQPYKLPSHWHRHRRCRYSSMLSGWGTSVTVLERSMLAGLYRTYPGVGSPAIGKKCSLSADRFHGRASRQVGKSRQLHLRLSKSTNTYTKPHVHGV